MVFQHFWSNVKRNLNQFIPFLEKCLELSNKVCFILPKSFISSPIYDEIRHKIEKKKISKLFGIFLVIVASKLLYDYFQL